MKFFYININILFKFLFIYFIKRNNRKKRIYLRNLASDDVEKKEKKLSAFSRRNKKKMEYEYCKIQRNLAENQDEKQIKNKP